MKSRMTWKTTSTTRWRSNALLSRTRRTSTKCSGSKWPSASRRRRILPTRVYWSCKRTWSSHKVVYRPMPESSPTHPRKTSSSKISKTQCYLRLRIGTLIQTTAGSTLRTLKRCNTSTSLGTESTTASTPPPWTVTLRATCHRPTTPNRTRTSIRWRKAEQANSEQACLAQIKTGTVWSVYLSADACSHL